LDILLLLIPLSVTLALFIVVALWWAVASAQFEELGVEAERILDQD
jgi:cbb3-type cytochrome oxidase maturation protein